MDVGALLQQGQTRIAQTTRAHSEHWGLGQADRWVLNQDEGRILWSFEDRVVTADAQILGSWNGTVNSFVWSWDNDTIQDRLCATAARVRAFGVENDVAALSSSPLNLDESQARDLVALAFRLGDCTGLYHPYDGRMASYITFGPVTIEKPGGATSTFEASLT